MPSFIDRLLGRKAVPPIGAVEEQTREGLHKAFIPRFLFRPAFGYPRFTNVPAVRHLAKSPYVEMCITTILDQLASVEWDVVLKPGTEDKHTKNGEILPEKQEQIRQVKNFLNNPNTNPGETFEEVFIRRLARDMLEVNTGVLIKVFNLKEEMVEIVARDGASFTINPDRHGMLTDRAELLLQNEIVSVNEVINEFTHISDQDARNKAAYFQFGFQASPQPVPFGKREIVWIARHPRTDDFYGRGPVEILLQTIQLLIWCIDSDLDYFNDNNIPKGIIGLDGSDAEEIKAFKEQWIGRQRTQDALGQWRKRLYRVPIVGHAPTFTRIEFSSAEMQVIEKQKWYTKIVWALFGVTPTELGFTEDAAGAANQIVQSRVFRKRAINPLLRKIEQALNNQVLPEFEFEDLAFKFKLFDTEEEKEKWTLYQTQIETGARTVNEIRQAEGMDPVEWGDKPPRDFQKSENSFTINGASFQDRKERANNPERDMPEEQADQKGDVPPGWAVWYLDYDKREFTREEAVRSARQADYPPQDVVETADRLYWRILVTSPNKLKRGTTRVSNEGLGVRKVMGMLRPEGKSAVSKPFAGFEDFDACVIQNQDKSDPEAFCSEIARNAGEDLSKAQFKALANTDTPLDLGEGEVRDVSEEMAKLLKRLLRQSEAQVLQIIQSRGERVIDQLKADSKNLKDLVDRALRAMNPNSVKTAVFRAVRALFNAGVEKAEKEMDRNFLPSNEAIQFLQQHTFENVADMTEELANDLRAELERGIINGEGSDDLAKRVRSVFDVSENRAEAIARTEANRAANQGMLNGFKQSGEPVKKFLVITEDHRTSQISLALGKKYGSADKAILLDEDFEVVVNGKLVKGPAPPFHVNERDVLAFTI